MDTMTTSDFPVQYLADYQEPRSRLSTFFRGLLFIPLYFTVLFWAVLGLFSLVGAWFALMVTGRYPEGLYRFNAGVLRHFTRVGAYVSLVTDRYPPLGISESPDYPVRVAVGPPQAAYSRVRVFFRYFLALPFSIVAYALMIVASLATFAAWFVIVVTGRQPSLLQEGINLGLSYSTKVNAFLYLLSDAWPLPIAEGSTSLIAAPSERPLGAA